MSLLTLFWGRKTSANVARERLQIILAHERTGRNVAMPDYLPALQREFAGISSTSRLTWMTSQFSKSKSSCLKFYLNRC